MIMLVATSCTKEELAEKPKAETAAVLLKSTNSQNNFNLIAGQNEIAGNISIEQNELGINVIYTGSMPWSIAEMHLWVGSSLDDLPQTGNGNPKIGQFPYSIELEENLPSYSFFIPFEDLPESIDPCNDKIFIVAHAVVSDGMNNETAWGEGYQINAGGNWAMYFQYALTCPEPQLMQCKDAYAYGDMLFTKFGTADHWGYANRIIEKGHYETPIYASTSTNPLDYGSHRIGTLIYDYDAVTLEVTYKLLPDFYLSETAVHVSSTIPDKLSPSFYEFQHNLDGVHQDSFSISITGSPIYLIAYAKVCTIP